MGILRPNMRILLVEILLMFSQAARTKEHRRDVDYAKLAQTLLEMAKGKFDSPDSKTYTNISKEVENRSEGDKIIIENLQKEIQWERQERERLDKRFFALQKGFAIEKSLRKDVSISVLDSLKKDLKQAMDLSNKTVIHLNHKIEALKIEAENSQKKFRDEVRVSLEKLNGTVGGIIEEKLSVSDNSDFEGMSAQLVNKLGPFLNWMNKTSQLKGIGSSCNNNADCWVNKAECRENTCYCEPGRSYNPENWSCVRSCTEYGLSFQKVVGYYIVGHNQAVLKSIGEEDCKSACFSATLFACITIDYFPKERECYLQSITKLEVKETSWARHQSGVSYHFQRDCG
ncbi:hypothetical protein CHS0354_026943 [Potamilus streckersoni]|uniref:Apple domain-containing protein n=1 Tax=Potamilus streckersoni TaxID=2493646 RepID=A0AAE0VU61_9BIVA|nr:hypothetical protein CHS0354_026943 [Potamilus streckersoni]